MAKKSTNILTFVAMVFFVVGWVVFFYFYTPAELIEWIGVTNAYLVAFLISVFGAIASMTPVSTYPAIYTFAAGGVSPWMLIPLAAVGLTIGDLLFVYFGLSARRALSDRIIEKVERVLRWLNNKPDWFVQVTIFVWVGILPIANNLLTAPLAMTGFRVKKMVLPLILGNMTFPAMAALLGLSGVEVPLLDEPPE